LSVALSVNGKGATKRVHLLVLEAFADARPAGQQGRHGPGGVRDNGIANLCWGTPVENSADRERDGTSVHGEAHQGAKLTEAIVLECRSRHAAGETQTALAAEFGVRVSTMSHAVRGITWSWLPDAVPARRDGFRCHNAKFTPETAEEVGKRVMAGESRVALAAEYGVTKGTLWRAAQRQKQRL
jgi:hypothetical protein